MSAKSDVTLKDIAAAVGKSVTAVSRALNDYPDISQETRQQIKQVAQQMGYRPNLIAQRLQKRTTDSIGLILPVLSPRSADPFFSELLVGIANEATSQGFDLLVSTCPPTADETQAYHRLLDSRRVDGLIVARPRQNDPRLQMLQAAQFPTVVVGCCPLTGLTVIADDVVGGVTLVVKHLVRQQHRQIALVNTPPDLLASQQVEQGFRLAMQAAGCSINEAWLTSAADFTQGSGYAVGQWLLSQQDTPTAIAVADDVIALGVLAAVQGQGFEVGHDVAITGYGDILLAEHSQPPLTTVQRPTYTLGQQASRALLAQLQGKPFAVEPKLFKPSLVIRQSSDLALWL